METHLLVDSLAKSAGATDTSPGSTLSLAAQVFATAEVLFDEILDAPGGMRALPERPPLPMTSIAKLRAALSDVAHLRSRDAAGLYGLCVSALSCVDIAMNDRAFPMRGAFEGGMSRALDIPLPQPLSGAVRAWLRPVARWRDLDTHRRYLGPAATLTNLDMVWVSRPHRAALSLHPVAQPSSARPHDLMDESGLSIALCPLVGAYRTRFKLVPDGGFTVDHRIQPHAALLKQIRSTIQLAIGNDVKCLVFPELSMDLSARNQTMQILPGWGRENPLRTVVAGSFHAPVEIGGAYPHVSATLAAFGKPLFEQWKGGSLTLPAREIAGAAPSDGFIREHNTPASEVHVMDTDAGRFAIVIASEADCPSLPLFPRAARPDFLIIIAYSKEPSAFLDVAEELAKHGISTFFVQAHGAVRMCSKNEGGDPVLAFARLAIPHDKSSVLPTRWRWRWKAGIETSLTPESPWVELAEDLEEHAYLLKKSGREKRSPVAMVLDVGSVFQRLVRHRGK